MPPKKKGKGKKKKGKPLTEEERQKQQAQKALAERERLAKRQKLTKAFLEIKKDKEYELFKVNNNKILDLWRPLLRKRKIQELLEDYKLMQLSFQRSYDKKNSYIEEMEQKLEHNEGEYDQAVDMHLHNIDKMMEFYRRRLAEVKQTFVNRRAKLLEDLLAERQMIQELHEQSLQHLRDNMAAIERDLKRDNHEAQIEVYMKEEDLKTQVSQEVHAFKTVMERKINNLWETIHKKILNYEQDSKDSRKEYAKYKERDEVLSALIDSQFSKLNRLKDGLAKLNEKMELFRKTFGKYFDELKAKKEECRYIYNQMITQRKLLVKDAKSNLQRLALCSYNIMEKINEMLATRDRILQAIERCRKEERQDEKEDPFLTTWGISPALMKGEGAGNDDGFGFDSDPIQKYMQHVPKVIHALGCDCDPCTCLGKEVKDDENHANEVELAMLEEATKSVENNTVATENPITTIASGFSMFEVFWIRFNKVTLEKEALKQRHSALLADNNCLRVMLRNYMGSLKPTDDLAKFTDELRDKNKKFVQRCMRMLELERKRKERCRKVGGVKVF